MSKSGTLGEVQFRKLLISELEKALPKTKFEVFHSSTAKVYNKEKGKEVTREFDIIIAIKGAVKLIGDEYIVPTDGRVVAVIEAKVPKKLELGVPQAIDGQKVFNSKLCYATNFKSLYDSSILSGVKSYNLGKIEKNIIKIAEAIANSVLEEFARKKPKKITDEKEILEILYEGILIILNEFKTIDPATIAETSGLLFATFLDYKTYQNKKEKEKLLHDARKSAAYILIDQMIFYNILSSELPEKYSPLEKLTAKSLRPLKERFDVVLDDDYSAIFSSKVIEYLPDGVETISAINKVIDIIHSIDMVSNKDLIGKIFHKLIPLEIRKRIAAFYTSNVGARLLAHLSIENKEDNIIDLACGSGTLLVESYKYKKHLFKNSQLKYSEKKVHKILLNEIYGNDVAIFATHLATINLAIQSSLSYTNSVNISIGDGFQLDPGKDALNQRFLTYFLNNKHKPKQIDFNGESDKVFAFPFANVVMMNPPFTRHERVESRFLDTIQNILKQKGYSEFLAGKMSLQHYFIFQADSFLKTGGRLAFVIPTNTFNVILSKKIMNFLEKKKYQVEYLIAVNSRMGAFSEDTNFKEYLFIAKKGTLLKKSKTKLVMLSKELPEYDQLDSIIPYIKSQNVKDLKKIDDIEISISFIGSSQLYKEENWDKIFWYDFLKNKTIMNILSTDLLIQLKDSVEFSFITGFHSTHCKYLIIPNKLFKVIEDKGDHGLKVERIEDGVQCIIPSEILRFSLREPKKHQCLYEKEPKFWVLSTDKTTKLPTDFSKIYLNYTTEILSEEVKKKSRAGGKVKADLNPFWYCHPKDTGCDNKTGHVWTFNRYGLWKRRNLSLFTEKKITANDGFHVFSYKGDNDETISLKLLNSWYNCSLHIFDFLNNCRVPAIHVQQVLKNNRGDMLIPKIEDLFDKENLIEEILTATDELANSGNEILLEQFDETYRKNLDKAWLRALNVNPTRINSILKKLYEILKHVINNR